MNLGKLFLISEVIIEHKLFPSSDSIVVLQETYTKGTYIYFDKVIWVKHSISLVKCKLYMFISLADRARRETEKNHTALIGIVSLSHF